MDGVVWGVLAPDQLVPKRAGLDLGLRTPLLHYADMSVPGIGGVSFVRQLVWPCLAIGHRQQNGAGGPVVSTARFATAIEALACKLWLDEHGVATPQQREGRIGGVRTLPARGWSFRELGPPQGYVTNPKRRAATRALPEKDGLGFTRGGLRLDRMVLTPFGEDLVADALEGKLVRNTAVRDWLRAWVAGDATDVTGKVRSGLRTALDPFMPTPREKRAVRAALLRGPDERRRRLIDCLEARGLDTPFADVETQLLCHLPAAQAAQIRAAWAFRRLMTAAQSTVRSVASTLLTLDTRLSLATVLAETGDSLPVARDAARHFLARVAADGTLQQRDAIRFAEVLVASAPSEALSDLVQRAGPLFRLEGGVVAPGPAVLRRLAAASGTPGGRRGRRRRGGRAGKWGPAAPPAGAAEPPERLCGGLTWIGGPLSCRPSRPRRGGSAWRP